MRSNKRQFNFGSEKLERLRFVRCAISVSLAKISNIYNENTKSYTLLDFQSIEKFVKILNLSILISHLDRIPSRSTKGRFWKWSPSLYGNFDASRLARIIKNFLFSTRRKTVTLKKVKHHISIRFLNLENRI